MFVALLLAMQLRRQKVSVVQLNK